MTGRATAVVRGQEVTRRIQADPATDLILPLARVPIGPALIRLIRDIRDLQAEV